MEMCSRKTKGNNRKKVIIIGASLALLIIHYGAFAQDGIQGINEANTKVRSYFSAGTNLMYAAGSRRSACGSRPASR